MTTSGLASPPRAAPPRVRKPAPTPPRVPPRPPKRERASFDRVLGWSIAASILAHLLLLLLSPFVIRVEAPVGGLVPAPGAAPQPFGLEMIVAIPSENAPEVPPADERAAETPTFQTPPASRAQPVQSGQPGQAPPSAVPPGGSTRDALRPGYRDPRLYAPVDEFPELRRTEHERYMEHLQARIDAVNDSLGVEAARNSRTSDWTITDGSGNRWGLSPEGLHLGGITVPREVLPLPRPTGDNSTLDAERERQRQREEIQRQEEARERDRTREERTEAIRNQRDG